MVEQDFLREVEEREAVRHLAKDFKELPSGAQEVDRRVDAANDIALLLVSEDVFIVTVKPADVESLPFQFQVHRDEAADAYQHPYTYIDHIAA